MADWSKQLVQRTKMLVSRIKLNYSNALLSCCRKQASLPVIIPVLISLSVIT